MSFEIDRLLDQDMLAIYPITGEFDVDVLASGIANIDYSFRDETRPERFLLTPRSVTRDAVMSQRHLNPTSPFPMLINVEAHPDVVMVWPATFTPELRELSEKLITWLLSAYRCKIENDCDLNLGESN
jgi:hypothetical protein